MLKIFYGTNTFNKRLELAKLKADFIAKNGEYSVRELSAEDVTPDLFSQDLMASGLFSSRELIVLKNAEDNPDLIRLSLEAPETELKDLILIISSLDKRTSEYKAIQKHAGFTEFANLPEAKLKAWIAQTAKKLDLDLNTKVVQDLILRTESDQQEIWICLNQLALLQTNNPKPNDLDIFLAPSSTETAFNLLEAALKKDRTEIQKTLKELELFREDPYQIIGLLCSQGFSLAAVTYGLPSGKSPQQVASEVGIHPFVASQQAKLARSLNLNKPKISQIADSLHWLDISLKTINKTEPWPMIDAALMRISML
ncbi:MAG: polymerase subunit delta [Patescibacteria group bacterium]|nr:polymerase subunit delta [Patescibacteria group bacterium]